MKRIAYVTLIGVFLAGTALAQDDSPKSEKRQPPTTLFSPGTGNTVFSGYGAPVYKFGRLKGEFAHYAGVRGGLIINDSFVIGLAGYGLAHPDRRESYTGNEYAEDPYIGFGYGGALIEYTFFPKRLVNFTLGATIGGGGLVYHENDDDDEDDDHRAHHGRANSFFVVEPEATISVNVTRFCRVGAGVSYRYVNGIRNDTDFDDADFSGLHGNFMVSFGWF
jgi:hypothetical protein